MIIMMICLLMIFGISLKAQQKYRDLDAEQFSRMIVEQPGSIIDTRTEQEFENGHIAGAININYYSDDAASRMLALDKSKPVYVYCQAGGRARMACDFLTEAGFTRVYHLKGDIIGWEKAGKKIMTEDE